MTSPSVDLDGIMPYGVTVEGTGNRNAEIVTESKFRNSNVALTLPDGPCRVAASWDGSEAVRLVHSGHGYPVVLPAGGGISLRDCHGRSHSGRNHFPTECVLLAPQSGRARNNRSVPTPAALTAGAVV